MLLMLIRTTNTIQFVTYEPTAGLCCSHIGYGRRIYRIKYTAYVEYCETNNNYTFDCHRLQSIFTICTQIFYKIFRERNSVELSAWERLFRLSVEIYDEWNIFIVDVNIEEEDGKKYSQLQLLELVLQPLICFVE